MDKYYQDFECFRLCTGVSVDWCATHSFMQACGHACALKIASAFSPQTLDQGVPGLWRNCFLKLQNINSERLRRNTPRLFAEPPPWAQSNSLIYRHVPVEGKFQYALIAK